MHRMSRAGTEGYTYVGALAVLVGVSLTAQTAFIPTQSAAIRDREAELLFRGEAYRAAIARYWAAGGAAPRLPERLEDLLDDPRGNGLRHLRRMYPAPLGGEWEILRGADGGIAGVAPRADGVPRRRANFPEGLEAFADADTYADWRFQFEPPSR